MVENSNLDYVPFEYNLNWQTWFDSIFSDMQCVAKLNQTLIIPNLVNNVEKFAIGYHKL